MESFAVWKVALNRTPVGDTVAEGKGRVYFEAITPSDGTTRRQLWEVSTPDGTVTARHDLSGSLGTGGLRVPPVVRGETAYVVEGQKLTAFSGGKTRWVAPGAADSTAPFVTDKIIYKNNFDGSLIPLDPTTGKPLPASSPQPLALRKGYLGRVYAEGHFLLLTENSPEQALSVADPTANRAAWSVPATALSPIGPARPDQHFRLDGTRVVFYALPSSQVPRLTVADIDTGKVVWTDTEESMGAVWAVGGGRVVTLTDKTIRIWDGRNGRPEKTLPLNLDPNWLPGPAVVTGNVLVYNAYMVTPGFGGIENRMLVAENILTGKQLFAARGGTFDLLFSVGASGTVYTNLGPTLYALRFP